MGTRWLVQVTDSGDRLKRSREYDCDGDLNAFLEKVIAGRIEELTPNGIHKLELEYRGESAPSHLPLYPVVVEVRNLATHLHPIPICHDAICEHAHICANHVFADDSVRDEGMSPDIIFQNERWGCLKFDTGRHEGPRGAGIHVETELDPFL